MWMALDAGLLRFSFWGDGSVPHRFLVLNFITVVYFVGGSQLRTWIQISQLPLNRPLLNFNLNILLASVMS